MDLHVFPVSPHCGNVWGYIFKNTELSSGNMLLYTEATEKRILIDMKQRRAKSQKRVSALEKLRFKVSKLAGEIQASDPSLCFVLRHWASLLENATTLENKEAFERLSRICKHNSSPYSVCRAVRVELWDVNEKDSGSALRQNEWWLDVE